MRMGMIGLGRMGANMAERLIGGGHEIVGTDIAPAAVEALREAGGEGAADLDALVAGLLAPRVIWLMVPAGIVQETLDALAPKLLSGDVVVDGGNSNYRDTQRRAGQLASRGVSLVDAGTSGGVWGRTEGYSLMVGGEAAAVERLRPVLQTLAPGTERGWGHVGPAGSGHFVKMVHNGIEYGLMQAYAEGFDLLRAKQEFDLDLAQVSEIWRHGSVVRSWLLDLTAAALAGDQELQAVKPWVQDSGEGRWTVDEAVRLGVSAPVIALSLMERFASRDETRFADRLLAALRQQFGGHAVKSDT